MSDNNAIEVFYKEISVILEVPIGTVKARIARGIGRLKEMLLLNGSATSEAELCSV